MDSAPVGDIVSKNSKRKLVALHQYTPTSLLSTFCSVSELLVILCCLIVMAPAISFPSLYQVIFGSGCPVAMQPIVRLPPAEAFKSLGKTFGNSGVTENVK